MYSEKGDRETKGGREKDANSHHQRAISNRLLGVLSKAERINTKQLEK